eukprot:141556_1
MTEQLLNTSSTGEQEIDNLDMDAWLKQNRLTKLKQYFEENEVILADLLKYEEKDMDVVLNDVNITAGAYVKRFKDSVRELQHSYNKTNSQNSLNKIYRIVTSKKEDESIKVLESKLTEIDVTLAQNMNITSKCILDAKKIESNINSIFAMYKAKIEERQKFIINKLTEETNKHLNILQTQKRNLENYRTAIQVGTKEQNSLLLDPQFDTIKREIKIQEIANNVMNSIHNTDMNMVIHPLQFNTDNEAVMKHIKSIGQIVIAPDAPTIIVSSADTVSISINIECKTTDITSYSVEYKEEDVEEMKIDWQEIVTDNNQYKLTKLQPNTKYIIRARYKIGEGNMWSQYSKQMICKTLKIEEKWDSNVGNGVVVNGNLAKWTKDNWAWYNALGTVNVKKGKHQWKLQFNKIGNGAAITVGVVTPQNEKIQWPFKFGSGNDNYAFGTGDGQLNKCMRESNMDKFDWNNGDVLVMLLDLTNKTVKYTINGKSATFDNSKSVVSTQNQSYKLVVCNIGVGTEVTLLSYNAL